MDRLHNGCMGVGSQGDDLIEIIRETAHTI